ncbi:MAG: SusC/RagA family TonB-linked outer membrane protein, partial [Segetibacter sp.]
PNSGRGRFAVTPIYFDPSQWRPTNWQDQVLRTGIIQNYNLAASGGNDNVRYLLSANYFKNEGIVLESSLKRYSFRANIDVKINEKLNVGIRMTPSYTINPGVRSDGHFSSGGVLGMAGRMPPLISPYLPNGDYENPLALRTATTLGSIGAIDNPVAKLKEDVYDLDKGRILTNVFAEYKVFNNLKFRSSIGIDANFNRVHTFLSSKTGRAGSPPPSVPSGSASSSQELEWLNENLLTYEKVINKNNRITAIAGLSMQKDDYRYIVINGNNYPNNNVQYVAAAGVIESGTEQRNQSSLLSYYGRVNYALYDRYLLTGTLRRDGSSRFGEKNKYGTFPSAAFAWRMSEERFMRDVKFISNFKWRLSYGVSGNNSISNYAFVPNIVTGLYVLGTGQTVVNSTNAGRLANPYISWETMRSINLGADIGILNNRLEFTVDAYKSNTNGLLLDVNIPAVAGFATSLDNIGEVENKGLEVAVRLRNLINALKWNTSLNVSFNRNKVISLGGSAGDFIDVNHSRTVVGKPMGLFYTRVTDGVFNSVDEINKSAPQDNTPQPGDRKFKDVNHDGKVDNNDLDFVGDPNPDFVFGFTNNFSFKGFELNIIMNGSYGNDIYYGDPAALNLNGNVNNIGLARDRWRSPQNPGSGNIPRAAYGFTTLSDVGSDFYVVNGSFLRLSNITLAYNISATIIKKIRVQNVRLYLSGQNIVTLTDYPGYDPETASNSGNPLSQGFDQGIYPIARVFTLGLNLTF